MRRHAAARGEDAGRGLHAVDVLGRCLGAHEQHDLALRGRGLGGGRGEHNPADRGAGRRRQALRDDRRARLGIDRRVQHLVELARLDAHHGLALREHALAQDRPRP